MTQSADRPLTAADIQRVIDDLWAQPYRPAPPIVVHPRTAHKIRFWYRWYHLTRNIVWASPRWPNFIRWRLRVRRRLKAESRFARWVARHPYQPPVRTIPGVATNRWMPEDVVMDGSFLDDVLKRPPTLLL